MSIKNKVETYRKSRLEALQSQRLIDMVHYIYNNSDFYRNSFDENDLKPEDISGIEDIVKLPFTEKDALRENYPFGLFSNQESLKELHVSSGTTGDPTLVGYTQEDIDLWAEVMARALSCAGAEPGDLIQNAYGYGLFTGGLGVHYGGLELGLKVIPISSGQTKRQLKIMQDFEPRILACTPTYALYMAEKAQELGIDVKNSSWEIGVFGAEPWSEGIREEIEELLGLKATDIYGLSEIIGPGVAQECSYQEGLHVFSDVFYPEVIDPQSGQPVPEGEDGELVITTFTKKGIPILRYRTRDIVSMTTEKCKCGRTSPRISKVKGRTDDMIVVKGINVFPSQVEHVLMNIEETQPHYQLVVDRSASNLDTLEVQVEVEQNVFSDEVKEMNKLKEEIKEELQSVLAISARVKLLEPNSLERSKGKSQRVVDKRNV